MIEGVKRLRGWMRDGCQGAASVYGGGTAAVNDVRAFVMDACDAIEAEVAERYMLSLADGDAS